MQDLTSPTRDRTRAVGSESAESQQLDNQGISKTRLIIEIGSHGYGGQEVPQSAACKLETQESQ